MEVHVASWALFCTPDFLLRPECVLGNNEPDKQMRCAVIAIWNHLVS